MTKSYIQLTLNDGSTIKYVNKNCQDQNFYTYTGGYATQTAANQIMTDFTSLINQLSQTGILIWPEGGNVLIRKNRDNCSSDVGNIALCLKRENVAMIRIIERMTNEFEDLQTQRGIQV